MHLEALLSITRIKFEHCCDTGIVCHTDRYRKPYEHQCRLFGSHQQWSEEITATYHIPLQEKSIRITYANS